MQLMANPLKDFLHGKEPELGTGEWVGGSFACQECGEVTQQALLNYDEKLLKWVCSKKHNSEVQINV